jgi:predicted RecA/RadA family phage recombinase
MTFSEYMADREFRAKATAVTGCKSGELIAAGALTGVAAYDAAAGDPVEVTLSGVWELPKASGQINEGAAVWFDDTTRHAIVNASAAGVFPIGVAVQSAGTNDATCRVRLSGIPVTAVPGGGG